MEKLLDVEKLFRVEDASELSDWNIPLSFMKSRHLEVIEGLEDEGTSWRIKDRMRTVNVVLSLCLNLGVDPPDVVKTDPCARLECWIDPLSTTPQKALEQIGMRLQQQYERWQPKARYKQLLDPTLEDIKKVCTSYRRNAKSDRLMFHYNGHGVPRPTSNGEIWVFNKSYTQYIPLSLYDLQGWMNFPSVYVFDCSLAGLILERFKQLARQREQECLMQNSVDGDLDIQWIGLVDQSILLCACGADEMLPMNPHLPADLFTCCLTNPIKTALRWLCWRRVGRLVHKLSIDTVDNLPGRVTDRKTPLGELNWIFTAITDTIAWNVFPKDTFKQLYRQDLLVASLFRNYLLAERILHSYSCKPVTHPELPSTYQHPLWEAWDMALDHCLAQLPALREGQEYQPNPFFQDQMKAFQVWLVTGSPDRRPPEQLPIVLQVLLSQTHRFQALELLGRFLDLGPWAVCLALSVGIFPYVLKLLQSKNKELQPILVFIWSKILAVDKSCQADLCKDNNHLYFVSILSDSTMQFEYKTMAAFVLACIVDDNSLGQTVCLQSNLISICLEQLDEPNPLLRQWLALCLGHLWKGYEDARWRGVRDTAHEKLYKLLWDEVPEVRASGAFALGTFINGCQDKSNDLALSINQEVGMNLLSLYQDPSPIVRKEVIAALARVIDRYHFQFRIASLQSSDALSLKSITTMDTPQGWVKVDLEEAPKGRGHRDRAYGFSVTRRLDDLSDGSEDEMQSSSLGGVFNSQPKKGPNTATYSAALIDVGNFYSHIWKGVLTLADDPFPDVAQMAGKVVSALRKRAEQSCPPQSIAGKMISSSTSAPSSPTRRSTVMGMTSKSQVSVASSVSSTSQSSHTLPRSNTDAASTSVISRFSTRRKIFERGPEKEDSSTDVPDQDSVSEVSDIQECVETPFFSWCRKYFCFPIIKVQKTDDADPFGDSYFKREWRFARNSVIRQHGLRLTHLVERIKHNDQNFIAKNPQKPQVMKFHPYQSLLATASKMSISVWDIESGTEVCEFANGNEAGKVTALEFLNPHDLTYLMTGTDNGIVRVWRHWSGETQDQPRMVTAWKALTDMLRAPKSAGLVLNWNQTNGVLHASGDVRVIRLWDTHKEMKILDIPTGADSCVTCMVADPNSNSTIVAGCGEGSVRVYDKRLPAQTCMVKCYTEHSGWVVSLHAQHYDNRLLLSSCSNGDIRSWDLRMTQAVSTFQTMNALYMCEAHPSAPLMACCATGNQSIKIYNVNTTHGLSPIQYHTGFMGQKIGQTKCLAFHPHRLWLAAGSDDSLVSTYTWEKKR